MEEKRKIANRDESESKALMNVSRLHSVIIVDTEQQSLYEIFSHNLAVES